MAYGLLAAGALLGLAAVLMGAGAEHAVRPDLAESDRRVLETALRFNQIHAVLVIALALGSRLERLDDGLRRTARRVGWLIVAATVLFSFAIYASSTTELTWLAGLTPLGGALYVVAWLALVVGAARAYFRSRS